jgi:hypothetical protein
MVRRPLIVVVRPDRHMKRAHLILHAGCSEGSDSPDIHIRNAARIPKEASGMKDIFRLPDDLTDVYYYTPQSLRCNYYLRGALGKDGIQQYETTVLKHAKKLTDIPLDISGPDVAPIQDWWPSPGSEGLRIYELRYLDYVILDHDQGILYAAMRED